MNLAARINERARLHGSFTLRSGAVSDTYFDKFQFEADPRLLRDIAAALAKLVPPDTEVLAGVELGGIPIVTVLSQVTNLPTAYLRKEAKRYGTCKYAEGAALTDRVVVLVEDIVSSGGALLDAVEKLQTDGISPLAAICVIDRQGGGRAALAEKGVELRALFTMEEIDPAAR